LLEERKLRELGKNIMGVFLHIPLGLTPENLQLERDTLMRVIQEMVGQSGL